MTLTALQQRYVDEVRRCATTPWDRIEVHYEFVLWKGNRMQSYTSNSYRDGARSDLDLSFEAVQLLEEMHQESGKGGAEPWSAVDFTLEASGRCTFDHSHGMPPMTARTLAAQPGRGRPRPRGAARAAARPVAPAVSAPPVAETWDHIARLLTERGVMECLALNPPADPAAVDALERHLGLPVPAALRELLAIHDGQPEAARCGLFFGIPLLSVEGIRLYWENGRSLTEDGFHELFAASMSSRPPGVVKPMYANARWIPFTHDGGNNHAGIDLDPDTEGRAGQVITFGPEEAEKKLLGHSLEDFLARFHRHLRTVRWTTARGSWEFEDERHRRSYHEWEEHLEGGGPG